LLTVTVLLFSSVPKAIAADPADFDPGQGGVVARAYVNPYFGMRYPLPAGWGEGPQPPHPSSAGYYALSTPTALDGAKATILIAAQDTFFVDRPLADAKATLAGLAHNVEEDGKETAEFSTTAIAGLTFDRLDIHSSPLSRIVFASDIRCHVVIFVFTSADPGQLAVLAASLEHLSVQTTPAAPVCIKDYATSQTIRRRVEPAMTGPQFVKVPVRVLIGDDGRVKRIHVIRADPAQRLSIMDALAQWEFQPYRTDGRTAPVETGLTFEFKPAGRAD
jgi:hypothetical protein